MSNALAVQPANTIPLPVPAFEQAPADSADAGPIPADLFPRGDIIKFFPQQSYGFLRDQRGRELFFHLDEMDLLGPRGRREFVRVGLRVGFDCCRTSHGLRVKRMKIY